MVFRDTFPFRDNISTLFGLLTTVLSPSARRYFQESWLNSRIGLHKTGISLDNFINLMVSYTIHFRKALIFNIGSPQSGGDHRWQSSNRLNLAEYIKQTILMTECEESSAFTIRSEAELL